ncbi:hypothetical protein [Actinokineospora inagensis]|uniref:hypothetical protein n=1 Tax=Actinokineospora inagensis TaxID=103730 RepID=UPI00040C8F57|nr:hypothetical protein [Actinokineospora inagensis]
MSQPEEPTELTVVPSPAPDVELRTIHTADSPDPFRKQLEAVYLAYDALRPLPPESLRQAVSLLLQALGYESSIAPTGASAARAETEPGNVKEFIKQKRPDNAAERIACLAYYLAEYRGTTQFKMSDIEKINREAAMAAFGNPTRDLDSATRGHGFLVAADNGAKQLSHRGEAVVAALPDRAAVRAALTEHPAPRRKRSGAARPSSAKEPVNAGIDE